MAAGAPKRRKRGGARAASNAPGGPEDGPQHIGTILTEIFRETGLEERVRENRALFHWEEAAGEDLCRHARAAYVEKGTLWVEVNNSVRMHNLQMQEDDLRERLNGAIRRSGSAAGPIDRIRFRLAADP